MNNRLSYNPSLTIRKTLQRHRTENPDSMLSEKAVREAVKSGELPSVSIGNRALISWDMFESWRQGNLNDEH